MEKTLTSVEVMKLIGYKGNFLTYSELTNYNDIYTAMGPYKALVLLYLTKSNFGHYTCIFEQNDNTIEFFDSYGFKMPDDEFTFIPYEERINNNEIYPHLTQLLYNSDKIIVNNIDKLQQRGKNINTCGRHVACRLYFRDIDIDEYVNFMYSTKLTPDELVTYLTNFV